MTQNLTLAAFTTAASGATLWIWCATAWYQYTHTTAEIEPVFVAGLALVGLGALFAIAALAAMLLGKGSRP